MTIEISAVAFEHHIESLGIPEAAPRISWQFSGSSTDWLQTEYEIELQYDLDSNPETFACPSSASILVPWPSRPLRSSESATIRVRSSGNGHSTVWSQPQKVEAGLLNPEDWACDLIETSRQLDCTKSEAPVLFRRDFHIPKEIAKARLYITAHGVYEAEINGQRIGDHILAPGWTVYNEELTFQTFDVTEYLKAGEDGHNTIGVSVAEGWYCGRLGFLGGRHNIWGERLGLIAQLCITFVDGTTSVIPTDHLWKYDDSSILASSIYDGESTDLNKVQDDWTTPRFDATQWKAVVTKPNNPSILRGSDAPPIREVQRLAVTKILESPSGQKILDFGQNLVGMVEFRIPRASQGHTIQLRHAEVLEDGECATRPLRIAKATDELTLTGKQEGMPWRPRFTFHGFRYVEVKGWPQTLSAADFTAVVVQTDMKKTGTFECSDPLLNRLHQNVVWSMKGNFVGIPTDCPQRDERLGWTGDIQAFAPTASFLYDCMGFLKSWLRGLAIEQKVAGTGIPPLVSPNVIDMPFEAMAIWGDCLVLVPWDLYQSSGDEKILQEQFASMESWMEKGIPRTANGLWADTEVGQLGDWLDPAAPPDRPGRGTTDSTLVANAFLIRSTDVMAMICSILGYTSKQERYLQQASSLRKAFAFEYITESGRITSDSQTAIALAIHFGLFPTTVQQDFAISRLDKLIRRVARFKIATGFAGTPIIGHALTEVGYSQLFYRMLMNKKNPSWLYPVTMGATTIWERWDSMLPDGSINPGEMTSFNHYALGSVADWMHTVIGGLKPLEPGWKKFLIKPIPGGKLTYAHTKFHSPYGVIKTEWEIVDGVFELRVEVPPNTTADIVILDQENMTVGSGNHVFRADYVEPERPSLPAAHPYAPEDDDEDSLAP